MDRTRLQQMLDTFDDKIDYVRKTMIGVPKTFVIDLSVQLTDQEYGIAGNLFFIWEAPDEQSYINVKINTTKEDAIPFSVHTGVRTPFDRLFITTPAGQAGNMRIIYGTEAPELLELIDNRSTTVAGVGGVLDELVGDLTPEGFTGVATGVGVATLLLAANVNRKSCIVQALSTNTGPVFLGYDNTVTVGGAPGIWFAELQPGDVYTVDDYRGDIYGISTAAQVVGVGEV